MSKQLTKAQLEMLAKGSAMAIRPVLNKQASENADLLALIEDLQDRLRVLESQVADLTRT
jgi:hypothetical protein